MGDPKLYGMDAQRVYRFVYALILGLSLWTISGCAKRDPVQFTIVYSNNCNGEVEPCG